MLSRAYENFFTTNDAGDDMTNATHLLSDKIINRELADIFMRGTEPYGAFKALVRFAEPENKAAYIDTMELHSPGLFKVSIPCGQIIDAADDDNILSIELREYAG